jgi:hypothetical protein
MLGIMGQILRDVSRLLRSWWRVDAIRAPSSEGQLLRLAVSSVLGIGGRWWTIISRTVGDGKHGPFVGYRCEDGDDSAWLEVRPPPPFGMGTIQWTSANHTLELHPTEIEVYARKA